MKKISPIQSGISYWVLKEGSAAPMTAWEKNQISPLERQHGGPRVCSGRILGLKISSNLDTLGRDSASTLYILICNKENG